MTGDVDTGFRIEVLAADAPDEVLHQMLAVENAVNAEFLPDDPPTTFAEMAGFIRKPKPFEERYRWIATSGEGVVATAVFRHGTTEENVTLGDFDIQVHPSWRRRGIATGLLAPIAETAERAGRTLLGAGCRRGSTGEKFLTWLGGEERLVERRSRLRVDELDLDMLRGWIVKAEERAAGYDLIAWKGRTPEEHVDAFAEVLNVMNSAPREGYEMEDEKNTPEMVRAMDDRLEKIRLDMYTCVVRETATGEFAGFTTIGVSRHSPYIGWQWGTGTWPHHRDRGIGRWLKAANLLRVIEQETETKVIDTWNAGSNEPMLNINVAMGFRPLEMVGEWQVPLAAVVAAATARTGRAGTV